MAKLMEKCLLESTFVVDNLGGELHHRTAPSEELVRPPTLQTKPGLSSGGAESVGPGDTDSALQLAFEHGLIKLSEKVCRK
mmetsp:Transcript_904/g.2945  ORF Transcript_904/g.2945 Transcript_904/m.2945 type:complete len:81 (+) Transcript_904:252-494(+)